MPYMLIVPRLRKYQQGDIIDEKDEEGVITRYAWAVADVSDADAEKVKAIPHDPEQKQAGRLAAIEGRTKAIAALMPMLTPLNQEKPTSPAAEAKPKVKPKPELPPEPEADTPIEKGESEQWPL